MDPLAEQIIKKTLENGAVAAPEAPVEPMVTMTMPDGTTQVLPIPVALVMMLQQISSEIQVLIAQGEQMALKVAEVEARIPGFSKWGRKKEERYDNGQDGS